MPIGPVRNVQKQVLLYNSCQKTMHYIAGLLGLSLQIIFWNTLKNCNLAVDNSDEFERKFLSLCSTVEGPHGKWLHLGYSEKLYFFAEYWMFFQCPTQACFHPHTKSNWVSLLFSTSFDISLLGNLTRICVPLQNKILVLCTGCKRWIRKMFEFKIWKESMLVL